MVKKLNKNSLLLLISTFLLKNIPPGKPKNIKDLKRTKYTSIWCEFIWKKCEIHKTWTNITPY
jgi:hypothetical protein